MRSEPGAAPRPSLEESDVTVVGVVRDAARRLPQEIAHLRLAFGAARSLRFVVVESDSRDGTPEVLGALSRTVPGFRALSLGRLADALPLRSERIAHCRNRYLDELGAQASSDGYVVVADLDGVNSALTARAVESCFASPAPWDVCAANQGDAYYDIWALRHETWSPDDCWDRYRALAPVVGRIPALEIAVHSRMIRLDPRLPPIEVDSAFGGLAIYRAEALRGARYAASTAGGSPVCEHVGLHEGLRARGYRIFVHPALVNARATEHSWNRKWPARAARRLLPAGLTDPDPQATRPRAGVPALLRRMKSMAARLS